MRSFGGKLWHERENHFLIIALKINPCPAVTIKRDQRPIG
jgi:hypothetical protein